MKLWVLVFLSVGLVHGIPHAAKPVYTEFFSKKFLLKDVCKNLVGTDIPLIDGNDEQIDCMGRKFATTQVCQSLLGNLKSKGVGGEANKQELECFYPKRVDVEVNCKGLECEKPSELCAKWRDEFLPNYGKEDYKKLGTSLVQCQFVVL